MLSRQEQVVRVVREVLDPLIRADGGVLYVVSIEEDAVALHLGGSFSGCPGNTLANRQVIEPAILAVAPGARVTVTAGALIPPGAECLQPAPPPER